MEIERKKLNIVFTIDENFIRHFAVALVSVLENNKDLDLRIFVIHDLENSEKLDKVLSFFESRYGISVEQRSLSSSALENYKVSHHLSKAVYFRLFLTDILPPEIDKILFLDSDLVVTSSLSFFADFEFQQQALLAQDDIELELNIQRLRDMGFPLKRYFNAGVLLINLKLWRERNMAAKFMEIANAYMDKLAWWDQDILNICFYDQWEYFDKTYNSLHLRHKLKKRPVIIHYAGPSKPWQYMNNNPYKSQYWKYHRMTPFKHIPIEGRTLKSIWRKNYIIFKVFLINTFTDKNY